MNKKIIIFIGEKESKRFIFFNKAIDENIYSFISMSWDEIDRELLKKAYFVKIEPPIIKTTNVLKLKDFVGEYYNKLNYLSKIKEVKYLNSPSSIINTLDKVYTKNILMKNNIKTTEMIGYNLKNYDEFKELLLLKNCRNIFLKPRYGSGAVGIIAYRYNNFLDEEIIYTTLHLDNEGNLLNCKKVQKIKEKNKIKSLINSICKNDTIIEKWEAKNKYENYTYDLRVVYQFDKIDYIVARGSKSPITNLHLNNNPISIKRISLSERELKEIDEICKKTLNSFPGLNIAGIDILVTPNRKFKIIEVNSQGDLIYDDIYNKNVIYTNQVNYFSNLK